MSFAPYVAFDERVHAWAANVCDLYTMFFAEILDGGAR
jgi:hypothetical protein